jgi:8-amino-7-oxononanoate synthase
MNQGENQTRLTLSLEQKKVLLKQMVKGRLELSSHPQSAPSSKIPEEFYRVDQFPAYKQLQLERKIAEQNGITNPFFMMHEGVPCDTIQIEGRELINFSSYNYLGLNGDPRVTEAASTAACHSGTSASASRLVSGECPQHRELEQALAQFLGTEDSVVFVSGHTANLSTISALVGAKDLVIVDRLSHQSIVQGAVASGALRLTFPHNDASALDRLLCERRHLYERVLIVVEGIYSMDGDLLPLRDFVEVKNRHCALLMVDEAHSIGVAGETGRGITEHCGVPVAEVDILMGTLSKSLAGCGGYVAGSNALVELLKCTASGFVYSVGMPPPVAAASYAALQILQEEPERLHRLKENSSYFLQQAKKLGFNTGQSEGVNIVPLIIGDSVLTVRLSNALLARGFNVQPIYYPAVEERGARLRFFLSCLHHSEQIDQVLECTVELLKHLSSDLH